MDALNALQHLRGIESNKIIAYMDLRFPGWALPTATDVEWDAIALAYEPECNHRWAVWPFDYNKLCCAHCGQEKQNARN